MKIIVIKRKLLISIVLSLIGLMLIFFLLTRRYISTLNYYDPIYKGNSDANEVAFACNVVWGNEYLTQILKILNDNDIKITFFVGGAWAYSNEELLLQIYNDGHEIGSHGYKHIKYSTLSNEQIQQDILKSEKTINKVTGQKIQLLAPPYGDVNKEISKVAEDIGYKVIMWSIDTIDWNTKDYNIILRRIEKKHHPGAIILMHPTESTVKALPAMIENLRKHGYKIVPVSKVIS